MADEDCLDGIRSTQKRFFSILLPISVRIGGLDARVLYAGAAPGMIEDVLQVNCLVPAASPSGFAVPIVLSAGKVESPAGVTVAIQ